MIFHKTCVKFQMAMSDSVFFTVVQAKGGSSRCPLLMRKTRASSVCPILFFDEARGIQKPFSDKSTAQKMAWKIPRHFHFLICNPANRFGEPSRSSHRLLRLCRTLGLKLGDVD